MVIARDCVIVRVLETVLSMRNFGRTAMLAASVFAIPSLSFADGAATQPLAWQHGPVNAAISATSAPDGSNVGGSSKLELDTAGLQAAVTGSVTTNTTHDTTSGTPVLQTGADSGSWTRAQIGVTAKADGPVGSTVALTGQDQISQSVSPYAPGTGDTRQILETKALSGSVVATLPLLPNLDAQTGASASQSDTRNAAVGSDETTHLQTGDTQFSASLAYRATDHVTVNAGATLEQQTAALDGNAAGSASYSYVKPQAGVTVTPWHGAAAKLSTEQAVEPLNGANYMALANLSDRPQSLKIAPDRSWQTEASLEQKFGAASISASLAHGTNGSATELAPVAGGQTPASVDLKKKQKATIALSLPLEPFGLSDTQLQSQATWRNSLVRDPVTGKYRRANGEAPREASIDLTRTLPATDTKIGVSGNLGTTRDFYQVNQSTEVRTAPGVGAFLSYTPGPVSMNLTVDGLVGGSQQYSDTFYDGSRNGSVSSTANRKAGNRHISFSLSKKF